MAVNRECAQTSALRFGRVVSPLHGAILLCKRAVRSFEKPRSRCRGFAASIAGEAFCFSAAWSLDRAGHPDLDIFPRAFLPADLDLRARAGNFRREGFAVVELKHDLGAAVPFGD